MYQVVETTDEEQREMYRKVPVEDLIGMLIECNKVIARMSPMMVYPQTFKSNGILGNGFCVTSTADITD